MEERHRTSSAVLISLFVLINTLQQTNANDQTHVRGLECYDHYGRPQRCIPPFENAAFNLRIHATNTCGEDGDTHFCVQTGYSNKKSCDVCTEGAHGPEYLTDAHNPSQSTWWQSETIYEGVQYPNKVNLTLNLGKSFDITYIRIVFYSPRPESFAIYKRQTQNGSWIPYQYYSATCRDTYRLPDSLAIKRNEDEARALCTSEYSDISPLRDGNIAFSSLEGRPSAYNFENSTELQNWVTATDIQITLHRLNTFGDEVFGDPQVLRSYFYGIADIAVGARCKCNGHASKCVESTGLNDIKTRVCQCKHFTDGPDCEKCLPFYNDAPWGRATSTNVHECKACNCNGYSNKCFFDRHLYNLTKHGGHCQDCQANRDGPNCERCKENFYMREDGYCINCNCDSVGSRSLQCNAEGKCQCKPGVTGNKCDRCDNNYYNFGQHGCQQCGCDLRGSLDNTASCDAETGECVCKENVEGRRCRECKPGFFSLDAENKFGCTPCFCYGHTSECQSANGYSIVSTSSSFSKQKERWTAIDQWNNPSELKYSHFSQNVATSSKSGENVYFSAPDRFLGDQRASYNRLLNFKLQLIGQVGPNPSTTDIVLEGAGTKISLPIFAQGHHIPDQQIRSYSFRLHEHPEYSWQPSQSSRGFMSILSNLTAIKIRATYAIHGEAYLDDVELNTAHKRAAGLPATWIEQCTCPIGYLGQFCESCAPGYRHSPAHGGPFMPCIPCDCNKHADICDSETGRCICKDNTAGDTCDQCARGYYGNALGGTHFDCMKCPCPDNGACMQIADESVICLECPLGYFGSRCELCSDGYFGDPTGVLGRGIRLCKQCDCNGNVDPNAVGNCNHTSGDCLKCIHNTDGSHCDQCLPGHFGDPLAIPHGQCDECSCYPAGTEQTEDGISMCDPFSGNCRCKSNVIGKNCNECKNGFYNIASGNGCETCNCDPIGSFNSSCERFSGQCYCKPGVTGTMCNQCVPLYYGFSNEGCKSCDCDQSGSKGLQCGEHGQCPCNDNVEGRRCDRCKENKYDRHQGCINCPDCYNLVQDAANNHREKLYNLNAVLVKIASNPTVINDKEFDHKLRVVQDKITILLSDATIKSGGSDQTPKEKLDDFGNRLEKIGVLLDKINEEQADIDVEIFKAEKNVSLAKNIIDEATKELTDALNLLKTEGDEALKRAEKKSEQLGQQSGEISKISKEARHKADEIEAKVAVVKNLTQLANITAHEAYDKAKGAINLLTAISDDLNTNVSQEISQSQMRLDLTTIAVGEALKNANATYDQVLSTVASVNSLTLPDVDIDKIKNNTEKALGEAEKITLQVESAIDINQDVLAEFLMSLDFSKTLLERHHDLKNEAIGKLEKVKEAYDQAHNAVMEGDNTLKEANNTYYTLSGFQNQVQESSDKAKIALDSVPKIQELVREAMDLNYETEKTLSGAHANAVDAKKTSQHAQTKYAEQASKDAEAIREKANATKNQARKLRGEADQLSGRVVATETSIGMFDEKAKKDDGLAKDTKAKVGQAKSDSIDAKNQVAKAMSEVQAIIDELSNLREINGTALDSLDARLAKAEAELSNANLAARIESLQDVKTEQKKWMDDFNLQIKLLENEVGNIGHIAEALPEGCFKRIRLEL